MYTILLLIIYIAFISLGLPDSLLGSAWPVMRQEFGVPLSYAGMVSMIISGGTILSSLMSDRLTRRLGTGRVTAVSVFLTAAALMGFSVSSQFWMLCVWAVPYGLGAGAVDAALNNYVALHYSSRHMSWLHCFWGVGTIASPYIMSWALAGSAGWNSGYRTVSAIQFGITALLFCTLPLWKRLQAAETSGSDDSSPASDGIFRVLKIKGVPQVLVGFFAYCAAESTVMLWASSYLVQVRNITPRMAAAFASFFFIGITAGRFLSGLVTERLGDRWLIRIGAVIAAFGILCIALPVTADWLALGGLIVIGLGCAPVYPSIVHSTPYNFGKEHSQAIIGIQMACAYVGSTFMPPLFGLIANHISIRLMPLFLIIFILLLLFMTESLNRTVKQPA